MDQEISNNEIYTRLLSNGDQRWYQNNKIHRDNDQPAIIKRNGDKLWYQVKYTEIMTNPQ